MAFMEQMLLMIVHILQNDVIHVQNICDFLRNEVLRLNAKNDAAEARIAEVVAAKEAVDVEVASLRVKLAYMDGLEDVKMDCT